MGRRLITTKFSEEAKGRAKAETASNVILQRSQKVPMRASNGDCMFFNGREALLLPLASPWGNLSRGLVTVEVPSGDEEAGDCGMSVGVHNICAEQGHTLVACGLERRECFWFCQKGRFAPQTATTRHTKRAQTMSVTRYFRRGNFKEFLLINTSIFTNS